MIIRSMAPLRIGFAGGGTDISSYCDKYGGAVLNTTISMHTYCSITPDNCGFINFDATDINQRFRCESKKELQIDNQLKLHKGVYNFIIKKHNDGKPLSFSMNTYSDAPIGSGLGSSSTLVVTMIKAYMEWLGFSLNNYELAHEAYVIERKYLGLSGGKQDQYSASFGGFNYIEFFSDDKVIINPLPVSNEMIKEVQNSTILLFTGTSRDSSKIIDDQIKNSTERNKACINSMNRLKECVKIMKQALLVEDFDLFAKTLTDGWTAKKKTSAFITNKHIDDIYEFVMANGGKGAKISGAGGGGYMTILCNPIDRQQLLLKLKNRGEHVCTPDFTDKGVRAWTLK